MSRRIQASPGFVLDRLRGVGLTDEELAQADLGSPADLPTDEGGRVRVQQFNLKQLRDATELENLGQVQEELRGGSALSSIPSSLASTSAAGLALLAAISFALTVWLFGGD
jgi:hypothetical protein